MSATSRWISSSESVLIDGRPETIEGFYVGHGTDDDIAPTAIQPALPVAPTFDGHAPDHVVPYHELSPSQRRGFLDALNGRDDDSTPSSFAGLMIMAVERRAFIDWQHDHEPEGERAVILARLQRLAHSASANPTMRGHCRELLGALDLDAAPPAATHGPPLTKDGVALRIGLARFAKADMDLPAAWAVAWAFWADLAPDDGRRANLSEARMHAHEELSELIELGYMPVGVPRRPKTFLKTTYWAMNPALKRVAVARPDLPDVLMTPPAVLMAHVRQCEKDLLDFARAMASHTKRDSLRGLALLPTPLLRRRMSDGAMTALAERARAALAGREMALVNPDDIFPGLLARPGSSLNKTDSMLLCELLGQMGLGIEPDARFVGPALSAPRACLFTMTSDVLPSADYRAATLMVHLSAMMAAADGRIDAAEEEHLERHLEQLWQLTAGERQRLRAHLKWLLVSSPRLAPVMGELRDLSTHDKREIGDLLVAVASADGYVSAEERELLTRLFDHLEIPEHELRRMLARLGPDGVAPDAAATLAGPIAPQVSAVRDRRSASQRDSDERKFDALLGLLFTDTADDATETAFGEVTATP